MWSASIVRFEYPICFLLLLAQGCARQRERAVIGDAFAIAGPPTVQVARSEIAAWDSSRAPAVSIVVQPQGLAGDPVDVEVERAQRLVAIPDLVGVVGHGGSRASLAAAPVYNAAHVPQIVPTGTSRLLKRAGRWTFMLAPDDSVEGAFIARFVTERLAARRISVFFVRDEYGFGLRDGLVAGLRLRGLKVVDQVSYQRINDFRTLVSASFRRGVPDAVVVAGRAGDAGLIARFVRRAAPRVKIVVGDGALVLPELADSAGPAADSIYAVACWLPNAPDSVSRAFVRRFRLLAGRDPQPYEAMAHDAIMVLASAIRAVGTDRSAIRRYLLALGVSRPPYLGVTGPITFGPERPSRLVMARLRGDSLIRVPDR